MAINVVHPLIQNAELRETLWSDLGLLHTRFLPVAPTNNWFLTTKTFAGAANESLDIAAGAITVTYCPMWPVCPIIVVTDAAADNWTGLTATIKGMDQFGDFATQTVAVGAGTPYTATFTTAFLTLYSINITVAGTTTSSDSLICGFGKNYGLGARIGASADVKSIFFNAAVDVATVNVPNSTISCAGTPDAAKYLEWTMRPTFYWK